MESANSQKFGRISMFSCESSVENFQDSVDEERSLKGENFNSSISELISIIKITLSTRGITLTENSNPIEELSSLVSVLCTEYLKASQSVKEICLNDTRPHSIDEFVSVRTQSQDIVQQIFEIPNKGIHLSQKQCQDLIKIILGVLRDSAVPEFIKKIDTYQSKIKQCSFSITELKEKIKEQDQEIDLLRSELAKLGRQKKNFEV